jgi:hypothetical protein
MEEDMRPSAISLVTAILLATTPALAQTPAPQPAQPAQSQPAAQPAQAQPAAQPAQAQAAQPAAQPAAEPAPAEQQPGQPPGPPPAAEATPPSSTPPAAVTSAAPPPMPVVSKSEITLYGVADFTAFYDSVQNFGGEAAGNTPIPRDGTYFGDHSRVQFSPRGSRIGLRLAAAEFSGIKVTGLAEADFVGNQFAPGAEGAFYTNPTFRIRHSWVKIATSAVDVTLGQTWQVFGWIPSAVGYSVTVPGLPGELYTRTPQLRVSKVIKGDALNVEVAVAALRPPQRDSAMPDGQAGVRVLVNKLHGMRTPGPAAAVTEPLSIGVSGIVRKFEVPEFIAGATDTMSTTGWGIAADVFAPIIPPQSKEEHVGALSLTGEAVFGQGISDQYTGLTAGVAFPLTVPDPNPDDNMPAPPYAPNLDNGMVALTLDGMDIEAVKWTSFIGGLQYYVTNNIWVATNASYLRSSNVDDLTAPERAAAVYKRSFFVDGVVAWNITPAARVGLEVGRFQQTYVDNEKATSVRVQFGSWYLF